MCQAFSSSDVVFVGRVESIQPDFDPWDPSLRKRLTKRFSEEEFEKLETDKSPEALRKIKEVYSEILPESYKSRLAQTSNWAEFDAALEALMDQGKRIQFRVIELFQGDKQQTIESWADFGGCGSNFEIGETYLVYANHDNDGRLTTGPCSRTQRLTDAGEDLAYLHFVQHGGPEAARVYGFVTGNELDLRTPRSWDSVSRPLSDLVVELQTEYVVRHAATDRNGRFAFDGLKPGGYKLSVFSREWPEETRLLAGPRQVDVRPRGCESELFFVPADALSKP